MDEIERLNRELDLAQKAVEMWKDAYQKMKAISDRQDQVIREYQVALQNATT